MVHSGSSYADGAPASWDGGYRLHDPRETLRVFDEKINRAGFRWNALRLSSCGKPVHVYAAHAVDSETGRTWQPGFGKGLSDSQAVISALAEAVEHESARHHPTERLLTASAKELGDLAIPPESCMLFSRAQYASREDPVIAFRAGREAVPEPFDDTREVPWVRVKSLMTGQDRLMAAGLCYFDLEHPGAAMCLSDSNGRAVGSTAEEAILQGILELIERDAVAIWWYNRLRYPQVLVSEIADPALQSILSYLGASGREIWILDLSHDIRVPVYAALSRGAPGERLLFGFGAHTKPNIAIGRAVAEMAKGMPLTRDASDAWGMTTLDTGQMSSWTGSTVDGEAYLRPGNGFSPFQESNTTSISEAIDILVRRLDHLGIETFILDQTHPDLAIPCVKVIAPGLRPWWRRLAAGRLYNVPVRSGLLDSPKQEADMNPWRIDL